MKCSYSRVRSIVLYVLRRIHFLKIDRSMAQAKVCSSILLHLQIALALFDPMIDSVDPMCFPEAGTHCLRRGRAASGALLTGFDGAVSMTSSATFIDPDYRINSPNWTTSTAHANLINRSQACALQCVSTLLIDARLEVRV
jgi:hypothetical protein